MDVVIIKYNAGNIRSVDFALKRMGIEAEITDDIQRIYAAKKVIFPGVGEASGTMKYLMENGLDKVLKRLSQPVLGICLGQQLMCEWSEEGNTDCIGIFDQPVLKFPPQDKVPHMGWNQLLNPVGPLFKNVQEGAYAYFVHSYYVPVCDDTVAECDYINRFSAAMHKNNFYATQFHPEKSGETGQRVLENFISL
ncbi:MAG: imidazole glycerol phosphate synthase subunit HisH [Bacteroidales bacterium]|nr:imidazole glycerol phosphate synthase subunit HisH [Bacteroidales bacterium]